MNSLKDIYPLIEQEEVLYSMRKQKLILEANKLLNSNESDTLDDSIKNSISKVSNLRQDAIVMDNQVHQIQQNAHVTIKSFEALKNQKKNVELLLNTLNCFLELSRIKNQLPIAIEQQDIASCIKFGQVYYEILPNLLKEFCQSDYQFVENIIMNQLIPFQKQQFELAVKNNELEKINLCSGLARVLHLEQSLDKVKNIYGEELLKDLRLLEQNEQQNLPLSFQDIVNNKYHYPFLNYFVGILELIKPEKFSKNVQQYYGVEGVLELIDYLVSKISHPYLLGVLKQLNSFFEIEKMVKNAKSVQSYDNQLLQSISKKINLDQKQLEKVSYYCDEISAISSEYNGFLQHLKQTAELDKDITNLAIGESITEYLSKYLEFSQIELQQQIVFFVQKSEPLKDLWNFDKAKFTKLLECQNVLLSNGYHEWLEEIFYLIKQQIQRAISTENQIIASALINFIGFQVISDDLHQIALQLFHRYLKKEYFSPQAIGISQEQTVNNSFIILLFNILSNIPMYLKTLKSQIYSELPKGPQSQMIVGAVEEMIEVNTKKFQKLIEEKLKVLAENLKSTVKEVFEEIKQLHFDQKDVVMLEQEREYQKYFSNQIKNAFKGLNQWKTQFTQDNYEQMSLHLCYSIAKQLEQIIMNKKFHQTGAVILEKEVRTSINYLITMTNPNNKQAFARLQLICSTLLLESYKEMEDFLSSSAISELSSNEIKKIRQLRIDLQ
ncbi:unnamed protein product [Paramecium primaurelia]|uniref:Conserved oligomeric Golgi complex subunit 4 C-terminal domain-containing protein n=1 Tax=Paramecium primaurelia TaxID=5886 RepID=A0A8S1Q0U4_PARPR|nr:unnamed protein product [Paramecium primaurelia]